MRRSAVPCPDSSSRVAWRSAFASDAPEEVAELEQLPLARETCLDAFAAGVVDPLGRLADCEPFENGAGLEDLDRLLV